MHLLFFVFGIFISQAYETSQSHISEALICVVPEDHTVHKEPLFAYSYLKSFLSLNKRCTHIYGNLIIDGLASYDNGTDPDLSFLSTIEEISGSLIIRRTTVKSIPLTNLKIIRGLTKKGNALEIVPVFNSKNRTLEKIDLRNLRVVMNKNIKIWTMSNLNYLIYNIDWFQILEDPSTQKLDQKSFDLNNNTFPCHEKCEIWESPSQELRQYCFGPTENECQPRTKCSKNKDFKWCRFTKTDEITCNSECAGGCRGKMPTDCVACNKFSKNSTCTNNCAPSHNVIYGKDYSRAQQDKLIYTVGGYCTDSCPDILLDQNKICIYECDFTKYYMSGNKCIECPNSNCQAQIEEHNKCDLSKLDPNYPKNERRYSFNKRTLEKLTNCSVIFGALSLYDESFSKLGVTVPLLEKHLKNVKRIFGELTVILFNTKIDNLSFLSNLEEIRKSTLFYDPIYIMKIYVENLKYLGLRKLTKVYPQLTISGDTNLCYVNSLPWNEITGYKRINAICNETCHPLCTRGCWGPGNDYCYDCQFLKAGDYCVKSCFDSPGYYSHNPMVSNTSYIPKTECRKCHPLCHQNCTGPSPAGCDQCKYFSENKICVETCSPGYYPFYQKSGQNFCLKCHSSCYVNKASALNVFACSGPLNILGIGGCSACKRTIKNGKNETICHEGPCPSGYFQNLIPDNSIRDHRIVSDSYCEPCHSLCKSCSGPSTHIKDCTQCNGYIYNNQCVSHCPNLVKNVTSKIVLGGNCSTCHSQCKGGCQFENDNFSCFQCMTNKLFHGTGNKNFSCVTSCPANANYTEIRNGEILCLRFDETTYSRQKRMIIYIVIGCLALLGVFVLLFLVYLKWRSNQTRIKGEIIALYSNFKEPNMKTMKEDHITRPPNMKRLQMIPISSLIFDISGKPLGTGAFGKVYKGYWKVPQLDNKVHNLEVVIKIINSSSKSSTDEFLEEAKIMASVSHRHCLPLIGVCLSLEQPCLVSTYAEYGSLDKYLHKYGKKISSYSMLKWAEQIADGMAYLSLRKIIHRDLAARNVLVNSKNIIQITDFGLARLVDDSDESITVKSGRVPIRWLALETLLYSTYSSATDVWAYGVTLWEIFTYGKRPYEDLATTEIKSFLQQGNRLYQPEICTLDVYMVMIKCWMEDSNLRIKFSELITIFEQFSQCPTKFLYLPQEHINQPFPSTNNMVNMHQLALESELRPLSGLNRSDNVGFGVTLNSDSSYQLMNNSHGKSRMDDKGFLPSRKKRNISLHKIRSFSKFDLTKILNRKLQKDVSKCDIYQPTTTYYGNKTTCTSCDSGTPLFSFQSSEYDGHCGNPQIAKFQKDVKQNEFSDDTSKLEKTFPLQERVFVDNDEKENKDSPLKTIANNSNSMNKSLNLRPIEVPSQSVEVAEPIKIWIENENKNSPDSGNSHNFDIVHDSDDYLIPSHISSAGYYNVTPSLSPMKKSMNLNDSSMLIHIDDGYLEPITKSDRR